MFRHRKPDDDDRDWRERRGRFEGIERDTPERQQVRPFFEPPADRQTHGPIKDRPEFDRAGGDDDSDKGMDADR